jgi:hypothetical protein
MSKIGHRPDAGVQNSPDFVFAYFALLLSLGFAPRPARN